MSYKTLVVSNRLECRARASVLSELAPCTLAGNQPVGNQP